MAKSLYDNDYREIFKVYEDGKHRRYTLLFAVNGAAAAIAGLVPEGADFREVSCLLIALTIVLCADIAVFGQRIRVVAEDDGVGLREGIFSLYGKMALGMVALLLAVGWLAAAGVVDLL